MVRKYICDNCGTEFEDETKVKSLETYERDNDVRGDFDEALGEFCDDCVDTLKKIIKEGFSKGRA